MYINIQDYVPGYYARFGWSINYCNVIDSSTTSYEYLIGSTQQLYMSDEMTVLEATQYMFNYVADSSMYNGKHINVTIVD